ncbi:hypothetical protein BTO04_05455 [Polaribacter sp. SA4-10]|uniref:DUF6913 domain-containing protein n=1 Tax=Polaribacter sp. SA4-10 TaxID=754397 RepID=UPI000B3D2889|nr:hypothetical protein [Polaribacter sp. SA4-10]ARV06181.1 hypothetical protein BTO04_05455 [Polaribacter sp. SA4-10]
MKVSKFKQYILKRKFDKSLSKLTENTVISEKKIHTIGILTTEDITSKIDVQSEVEKIFNIKNSKIYSYRAYNKLDELSYMHFSENNINWKGEFTDVSFLSFLEQPVDLLIGYFNTNNLYLETAVLQSKASFKVGFSSVNSHLYQIEIAEKITNIKQYTLELKKYLQILKKIKN